ncbi:MAG: glycoside hydrolase family 36 protein [Eubacteriales bacterium]
MILDYSQNGIYIVFEITEAGQVALKHFSAVPMQECDKALEPCLISDIHLCGGNPDDRFGAKHIGASESLKLSYQSHAYYENTYGNKLEFTLTGDTVSLVVHLQFYKGISAVRTWKTVTNVSGDTVGLEYVPSFSYTGIDETDLKLFIPHNSWCREANWEQYTPTELGLDKYTPFSTKRISVSNTGTWSAKEYLPMAAAVSKSGTLMWQIEHNGSWQWELGDIKNMLYLTLSGPTEQEHSWYRELAPGECFESVKVCLSVGDGFDEALGALTAYRRMIFHNNEPNRHLPVIFNDYMHCLWADPTEEKELALIEKAAALGCEYYCMDAGWYADGKWWDTVGEWQEQKKRFPHGIKALFDLIRSRGMVPGIWLEIEVMGIQCPILDEFDDDCFFMRHGKRVINRGRYQLDFRSEKVRRFAHGVVDRVVGEYGAGFIKFDYNIDAGIGSEVNADSFGDGLLEHNRAYLGWIREIKQKYPDLVLENCSSGGLRMDYAMLSEHHIQSVTDQDNFHDLAYIAAAAPTAVLPEQAGIWVYPRVGDSKDEIAFGMVSAILQRPYLSGQIAELSEEGLQTLKEGIDCFKRIREEIPTSAPFYPIGIPKHGDRLFCVGFRYASCCRIALWCADKEQKEMLLPLSCLSARALYPSDTATRVSVEKGGLKIRFAAAYTAAVIELV